MFTFLRWQRLEVNVDCLPQLVTIFFETESFTEFDSSIHLGYLVANELQEATRVYASLALGLKMQATRTSFQHEYEDPCPGPHAWMAGTLTKSPSWA